jgi:hypothetical protein
MGPERLGEAFLQQDKLLDTYTKCLNAGLALQQFHTTQQSTIKKE